MTDFIEPSHSLLLNGYSKRIQGLIQNTKNYALKNEKINVLTKTIAFLNKIFIEYHKKNHRNFTALRRAIQPIFQRQARNRENLRSQQAGPQHAREIPSHKRKSRSSKRPSPQQC